MFLAMCVHMHNPYNEKNPNYTTNPYFLDTTIALPMKYISPYLLARKLDITERWANPGLFDKTCLLLLVDAIWKACKIRAHLKKYLLGLL